MDHLLLSGIGAILKYEPNFINIFIFVAANVSYVLVMRAHRNKYIREKQKKPLYFKTFWIYNNFFLSKITSRSDRKFYAQCNRISAVFGSVIILSFLTYMMKMFH